MSKIKGVRSARRLMKRIPAGMREELAQEMRAAGVELAGAMQARAPRRTGKLAAAITWRFYQATLRLRVGYIGKPVNRRLFYAHILNYGRKAKTVQAKRRTKSGKISTYAMRVTALAPRRFVTGPLTDLRAAFNRRLKGIWARVLQRVADGGDD